MAEKIGRNDPCPCGSGQKYKKCCGGGLVGQMVERFQQRMQPEWRPDEATRQRMLEALRANQADPAYIYAFEKTGVLVFQETMHLIEPSDLEAWQNAYEEYQSI